MIKPTHAVANTGAFSVFVLEGTPYKNKRLAENPITILLPDGTKVTSMHICNMEHLPFTLVGHIVPEMKIASLLGIQVLCKAGCTVVFNDDKCQVILKVTLFLRARRTH
jgi:hypothetical protein